MILVGYKIVFAAFWVFGRHWELTSRYLQMLPGKAIPATMLFLMFVRSGFTSTSTSGVNPSPSATNPSTPGATPSATVSTNSSAGGGGASPSTPSASITTPTNASGAMTSVISTMGGGSQGGVTPSPNPTTSGAQTVNMTATVSVADGKWNVVNPVGVYYYKGRTLFWRGGGGGMKSNKAQINCLHIHTQNCQ